MKMSKSKVLWGVGIANERYGWLRIGFEGWGKEWGAKLSQVKTYLPEWSGCNLWQTAEHIPKTCYILLGGDPFICAYWRHLPVL